MVSNVGELVRGVNEKKEVILHTGNTIYELTDNSRVRTQEVTESINQVADAAMEQAESSQEARKKADELSHFIAESESTIETIENMTQSATKLSKEGIHAVEELITKAELTKKNSAETKNVFDEMENSIKNIDYISNAIADITEQTNLLSLNASIEAARAGDAGKGFAVVADEIRQLAEQSKKSTDEIKTIVSQISAKSRAAGATLQESNNMLEDQNKAVMFTKEIFYNISNSIEALSREMQRMLQYINNMTRKNEDVVENIEDIAAISEEYAASAEQVTVSARTVLSTMDTISAETNKLKEISEELERAIAKFNI